MHVGLVIPPFCGHLNPGATLGNAIKNRGHTVTLISLAVGWKYAEREQLGFWELATKEENEEVKEYSLLVSSQSGFQAFQTSVKLLCRIASILLRDLSKAIEETKVDALLIDEVFYWSGSSVADAMNVPFGTMANAMNILHCKDGPPFMTTWEYNESILYRLRDTLTWLLISTFASSPCLEVNEWRQKKGLPTVCTATQRHGGLIQLAQQPPFFEFPKSPKVLPKHFFYTSPWHKLDRDINVSFPFEKIDPAKQLIYASLGTVQNNLLRVYQNICRACKGLDDTQLVIALGKEGATIDIPESDLPLGCIIVDFAPQLQILPKASLVITHCGMNTCLETLAYGLPAVAIPVTNDQPGVAARWQSLRAVIVIPSPNEATPKRIQDCIIDLLPEKSSYRKAAKNLQARLRNECLTLDDTARLIEKAFEGQTPLTRCDVRARDLLGEKQVEPTMQ